jgi:hypothetical protein
MAMEIEELVEAVFVLSYAGIPACRADEGLIGERAKGGADRVFLKGHHRFAIRFLIAGVEEGIEREGIVFGRGDFFFDKRAENADFNFRELQSHEEIITAARKNRERVSRQYCAVQWNGQPVCLGRKIAGAYCLSPHGFRYVVVQRKCPLTSAPRGAKYLSDRVQHLDIYWRCLWA